MDANRESDINRLMEMPKDKLIDLLFLQMRNIWSEDGLYFIGIEKRFDTKAAIEIDREVWAEMGKIEARRLKRILQITDDGIHGLFEALKHTSWWLDNEFKNFELEEEKAVLRNDKCYVQLTRIKKGLGEFQCKSVRLGFLTNFVKEFNPRIEVKCNYCPPDKHPMDSWCEWEFILKRSGVKEQR